MSHRGRRVIGISGSLIWSNTLMELMFNACGEFRWSPNGPVSQIHSPHLNVGASGIFSDLLRSVQTQREWGAESNGKLTHLFIPSKTATLGPEFAVEDLFMDRTATLVPAFEVKDLPLGRTLWWWWWWWMSHRGCINDPDLFYYRCGSYAVAKQRQKKNRIGKKRVICVLWC